MCTWTGYIGSGNAAGICLNMIRKIERLWSGYYSGLVTVDNKGLHTGKLKGSSSDWEKKFSLADFPGGCGLFHSRTSSGGGDESAHPFFDNAKTVALVSQGALGFFAEESRRKTQEYGNRFLDAGDFFPSAIPGGLGRRTLLKDGAGACMSEVVAHAAAEYYKSCHDPFETVRFAASEIPEESVTGYIFADYPDKIYFANTSQSLMAGRGKDGVYLATTSLAFPEDVMETEQLPYNAVSEISAQGWYSEMLSPKYDLMEELPDSAEAEFVQWLTANPGKMLPHAVDGALRSLCSKSDRIYPCCAVGYRILEKLMARGRVRLTPFNAEMDGLVLI